MRRKLRNDPLPPKEILEKVLIVLSNFALCASFFTVEELLRRCQEIVKEALMMLKELLRNCQGCVRELLGN